MARILYLDDDASLTALISRWLQTLGHSVSAFASAPEALAAFETSRGGFDLVLTDMSMPGSSGIEFAQQILAIDLQMKVIIATGCKDPNWADFARASGVRQVIEKPTTVEELAKALSLLEAQ